MKHVRSKKQKDKETLTGVLKEMAQPRFAKSAGKKKWRQTSSERKVSTTSTWGFCRPEEVDDVEEQSHDRPSYRIQSLTIPRLAG
jgi:hypothetical protein